jgi:hypothetical protein
MYQLSFIAKRFSLELHMSLLKVQLLFNSGTQNIPQQGMMAHMAT